MANWCPSVATGTDLIVNNIPVYVTDDDIRNMFSKIGPIKKSWLVMTEAGESSCYAFVVYHNAEDAQRAINTINGRRIGNKLLRVSYTRPRIGALTGSNLYVTGLPTTMDKPALKELFQQHGHVVSCCIITDRETGISKGVGFVRYNERFEAEQAIEELNGTVPPSFTEAIEITFAKNPAPRTLLPPPSNDRRGGPLHTMAGPSWYSPVVVPLLANPMLPGNAMNGYGWRLFVRNLAPEAEDVVLWQLFGPFGAVQSVNVIRDLQTNMCKGYGFVTMKNYNEAVVAIQWLNGYTLDNRVLQVAFTNRS